MKQVAAFSKVIETLEIPFEVTTHKVLQGVDSSQIEDIPFDRD